MSDNFSHFSQWVISRWKIFLGIILVCLAVTSAGVNKNRLVEKWYEYLDESYEITKGSDHMHENLTGILNIFWHLESKKENGVIDHQYLEQLDAFTQWLKQQPEVGGIQSHTVFLKKINQLMHNNKQEKYAIPSTQNETAQINLVLELSIPEGMSLDHYIDHNKQSSLIYININKIDGDQADALMERGMKWLEVNAPHIVAKKGTGIPVLFNHMIQNNIKELLKSTAIAMVFISMLFGIVLKSFKLMCIALISNLFPAILAYGVWGFGFGYIDLALAVVVCMSMGIVVDDTIHVLYRYKKYSLQYNINTAIARTYGSVGIALFTTSLILIVGFMVLWASPLSPTRHTGTMMALIIFMALLVDFIALPILLKICSIDTSSVAVKER